MEREEGEVSDEEMEELLGILDEGEESTPSNVRTLNILRITTEKQKN
jgi:hypothetical protein